MGEKGTLDAIREYYAQRAEYYDRVYFQPERQPDLREMERWVARMFAGRRVLEIACGTGWWTQHGARDASDWLATDLNPATIDVARRKSMPASVRFATVDAYTLAGLDDGPFDGAFAGCWWSHVPLKRLPGWLDALHVRLESGAQVVMLDNGYVQTTKTPITRRDLDGDTYQLRTLDDGTVHEVLKNFPTREQALEILGPRAVDPTWVEYDNYWTLAYRLT